MGRFDTWALCLALVLVLVERHLRHGRIARDPPVEDRSPSGARIAYANDGWKKSRDR